VRLRVHEPQGLAALVRSARATMEKGRSSARTAKIKREMTLPRDAGFETNNCAS